MPFMESPVSFIVIAGGDSAALSSSLAAIMEAGFSSRSGAGRDQTLSFGSYRKYLEQEIRNGRTGRSWLSTHRREDTVSAFRS